MPILETHKLGVYNGALRRLGSRPLASLTESRKPRRVMDGIWDNEAFVTSALEKGEWNFAIRSVEGVYSTSVEPPFGFRRAYNKPDDLCRLAALSPDEYFRRPLVHDEYVDEAGYFFTDLDVIYMRYVSNGESYGFNSAEWTQAFRDYLESAMAWEACETITNSTSKRDRAQRDMEIALTQAKSLDAMQEGVKFLPAGSWVTAKSGRRSWGRRG